MSPKYSFNIFTRTDIRSYICLSNTAPILFHVSVVYSDRLIYYMSLKYTMNIFGITDGRTYVSQILHQYYFHMRDLVYNRRILFYVSQIR